MGRRKKKSKKNLPECVASTSSKQINKINVILPKPRYLVLIKDHPNDTMNDVPLSQLTNVINNVAGKVNSIKKLRNGMVLIETKTETQSAKLLKLKYFPAKVPVKVTAHRWLNYSKGVIKCWELNDLSVEEMRTELRSQSVVDVKPIMTKSIRENGEVTLERTCSYVLTFTLPSLPKVVNIGIYIVTPVPYIPQPKMCYRCYQYGHISKHCKSRNQLCRKCIQPGHDSESCVSSPMCANCPQKCQSGHSSCIGYMIHRKILEIDCLLKNINVD